MPFETTLPADHLENEFDNHKMIMMESANLVNWWDYFDIGSSKLTELALHNVKDRVTIWKEQESP
jgi:hypothetical protein